MSEKTCVIVIPALNPENKMIQLVQELKREAFDKIVIVNDGSAKEYDAVFAKAAELGATVLIHEVNRGKGQALKTAMKYVIETYNQEQILGIITADADGQHTIQAIGKIAERMRTADGELVLGCRHFVNSENVKIPLRSKFGNEMTKLVMRLFCGIALSDTQTGLRGIFYDSLFDLSELEGEAYEYETNMLLYYSRSKKGFQEVPIETVYENNNESSHFNPVKDSFKIYKVILKYSMASLISALVDNLVFILLMPYISDIWALTFSGRGVSMLVNFTLNKKLVFQKEGNAGKSFLKYLLLVIFSGCMSAILLSISSVIIGKTSIIMKIIIEVLLYFFNFYIQKKYVFK